MIAITATLDWGGRSVFKFLWLCSFPLLIMLLGDSPAKAQSRINPYGAGGGFGVGVGVGGPAWGPYYGPGWGPYYGPGWYPGWGMTWMPNYSYYNGSWGNGLSLYGPPVPTHKPIPGVFGGGDSRFFGLPPLYPQPWGTVVQVPLNKPAPLPRTLEAPLELLPVPKPATGPVELEVRMPTAEAKLFIDGTATESTGLVRPFRSTPVESAESYTYDLKAEWKIDGLTYTHQQRVTVKPGEKVVVAFSR